MNLASVRARVHSPSCQRTANPAPYIALMSSFIITQCMWWFPGAQRDLWEREAMMVMWMAGCLRSWWSKQAGILDRMMLKCMVCVAGISVCRRETLTTLHAPNVYRRCTPSESLLQTFMLLMTAPSHPTLSSHPKSIHAPDVYRLYTSSESLLWTFSFWCLLPPPPPPHPRPQSIHAPSVYRICMPSEPVQHTFHFWCLLFPIPWHSWCIQEMHTRWILTANVSLLVSASPLPSPCPTCPSHCCILLWEMYSMQVLSLLCLLPPLRFHNSP